MDAPYGTADTWDGFYRGLRDTGGDLDWQGRWTEPFLAPLRTARAHAVLELGCGAGHDAARLAREGYQVTAIDFSAEAIALARRRYGDIVTFHVADIAEPLHYADASFDAVMANVAVHMFDDRSTRAVFAEIRRVTRPGGLFLFHVNALDDRVLRAALRPATVELAPDFVREPSGKTMHFFSDSYLATLLCDWHGVELEPLEISGDATTPDKRVWRGIACR